MNKLRERIAEFLRQIKHKKLWKRLVLGMACVVVFCTTYALMLDALTKTKKAYCGMSEHHHTIEGGCFERMPMCEFKVMQHVHSSNCYKTVLICKDESKEHEHTEKCYIKMLDCPKSDISVSDIVTSDLNTSDALKSDLIMPGFGISEFITSATDNGMSVSDLSASDIVASDAAESSNVKGDYTDSHYTPSDLLPSDASKSEALGSDVAGSDHVHSEDCYVWVLTCNKKEHKHSLSCFSNPKADVETEKDWEKIVDNAELTGNWSNDVIEVAKTQLGYKESDKNYSVMSDGETVEGYARYNDWYGSSLYDDWNATFAAFCISYAKVPKNEFPLTDNADSWVDKLNEEGLYKKADVQEPMPGSIVFFDTNNDGKAERVGVISEIVYSEAETKNASLTGSDSGSAETEVFTETVAIGIKTIEGDVDGQVAACSYDISDKKIMGYAALPANPELKVDATSDNPDGLVVRNVEMTPIVYRYNAEAYYQAMYGQRDMLDPVPIMAFKNPSNSGQTLIKISDLETVFGPYGYVFRETLAGDVEFKFNKHPSDGDNYTVEWSSYSTKDPYNVTVESPYVFVGNNWYLRVNAGATDKAFSILFIEMHEATDTITPISTVINLFDYWTTPNRFDSDNHITTSTEIQSGINKGHHFCFGKNMEGAYDSVYHVRPTADNHHVNFSWGATSTKCRITQGIVQNTLGDDGYPRFSGDSSIGFYPEDTESLAYLFNPRVTHEGKASYTNVGNLLSVNEKGYFHYDCLERYAYYDDESGNFVVYDQPATEYKPLARIGEFFPFNSARKNAKTDVQKNPMNHYFGMTMTTRFVQRYGGHRDYERTMPTTFFFSGDNDVWIFIDDVLVADVGGLRSAASVSINFSTGEVKYEDGTKNATNPPPTEDTTIKEAFIRAGREDSVKWSDENPNIFADNSTHVLKFYYLERGNYDSTLKLEFNLTEVPSTGIHKVDQYGDPIKGAEFAFYDANQDYEYAIDMPENTAGNDAVGSDEAAENLLTYTALPENYNVSLDEETKGVITFRKNGEDITITPKFTGITNEDGEMVFMDDDGNAMLLAEIESMFDGNFIMREIKAPRGYRVTQEEGHMYVENGVLFCANTYATGIYASPNKQIVAPQYLYPTTHALDDPSQSDRIKYYEFDEDTGDLRTYGTLFAVVLKRESKPYDDIYDVDDWYPVTGTEDTGYTVMSETGIAAAIEAAKIQNENGERNVFYYGSVGMKCIMENLPGDVHKYWSYMYREMLEDDPTTTPDAMNGTDVECYISYYYTTADSLLGATESNTIRVWSRQNVLLPDTNYQPFSIQLAATVNVPDIESRIFFQKVDIGGNLIDNAIFALYKTGEDEIISLEEVGEAYDNGEKLEGGTSLYYIADTGEKVYLTQSSDDPNTGTARVIKEDGTSVEGTYSIYLPSNLDSDLGLDGSDIDGYIHQAGAGVINVVIPTLGGTEGATEESETYTISPVTNADGRSLVGFTHDKCWAVSMEGTGHFGKLDTGTYVLREIGAPSGFMLNGEETLVLVDNTGVYANAGSADNDVCVLNGPGYLVETMNNFASADSINETLQWIYGVLAVNELEESYRSFGYRETPSGTNTWPYVAKDEYVDEEGSGFGSGRVDYRDQAMVNYYHYIHPDNVMNPHLEALFDYEPTIDYNPRVTQDEAPSNGGSESGHTLSTLKGENTLTLRTETGWSALILFQDYYYGKEQVREDTVYRNLVADGTGRAELVNILYLFSSSTFVRYTDRTLDMRIRKVDSENKYAALTGAEFVLYKMEDNKKLYYHEVSGTSDTEWKELGDNESEANYKLTTDDDGYILLHNMVDGDYFLKEIKAPMSYSLPESEMLFRVENAMYSVITQEGVRTLTEVAENDPQLLLVKNDGAYYELPATGGFGDNIIYEVGVAIMSGSAACLICINRKRKHLPHR